MIAKISATENLGGALGYNFKKVNKKEATLLLAHGLYQNRAGEYTMSEILADMQALIPEKCRTKKTVFHCSLNPHPDEKLSDESQKGFKHTASTIAGLYRSRWKLGLEILFDLDTARMTLFLRRQ